MPRWVMANGELENEPLHREFELRLMSDCAAPPSAFWVIRRSDVWRSRSKALAIELQHQTAASSRFSAGQRKLDVVSLVSRLIGSDGRVTVGFSSTD